mgnify:CR=1 FL=1
MAGRGTRLRPHTLTIPKPLLPIAGKPIVQRLVEDIAAVCDEKIDEVAFIIGDFGDDVPGELMKIAESVGAKGKVFTQDQALGTAHAVLCAKESLKGEVIVGFADTLFKADFSLDKSTDGTIWVHQVADPKAFGVVKINGEGHITDFVEKPQEFVSDLAIIGIYYFKDGENLRNELQYLIDNNIMEKGEYQITNALENMKQKGLVFVPGAVDEWMDCGNKNATVNTNTRILELKKSEFTIDLGKYNGGTEIIEPCYIGENVTIEGSKIGPHVSIGDNTIIKNCVIDKTIIQSDSELVNIDCTNSMIGNHVKLDGKSRELSLGDYSVQN